jgi:uncharacterized protein (DUF1778 family)
MPTEKPRITITLSEHQHELLNAMAKAQKVSMSSIVVELLDTAVPVLERVMELITAAKNAPQAALEELKRSLDAAEGDLIGMQKEAMGQLELLVKEASGGGSARRRAPAAPGAAVRKTTRPPTTNRGVRIPQKTTKSKAISPMKTSGKDRGVKK